MLGGVVVAAALAGAAQAAAPKAEPADVTVLRTLCMDTQADPGRVAAIVVARGWKDVTPDLGQDYLAANPAVREFSGPGRSDLVIFGDVPAGGVVNHMCGVVNQDPATPYPERLRGMEAFIGAPDIETLGKARWVWTETDGKRRFLDDVSPEALRAAAREHGTAMAVFMDAYATSYIRATPAQR
ncbi:hypothetical protein [Caulobacter sp. 17J65-9]|uniref:hypothetical protein n=1 Tax=Caulobacter sp. 17J65-9 TaxID=2709382 RepID=UPI0013C7B016|nr:hypothetical protein [Caulobacter sp. 17J65-9]NEX94126.1 hypothetical protein [Caulobacter sp. 17J65-9]